MHRPSALFYMLYEQQICSLWKETNNLLNQLISSRDRAISNVDANLRVKQAVKCISGGMIDAAMTAGTSQHYLTDFCSLFGLYIANNFEHAVKPDTTLGTLTPAAGGDDFIRCDYVCLSHTIILGNTHVLPAMLSTEEMIAKTTHRSRLWPL